MNINEIIEALIDLRDKFGGEVKVTTVVQTGPDTTEFREVLEVKLNNNLSRRVVIR